jgi:hypothetical protein
MLLYGYILSVSLLHVAVFRAEATVVPKAWQGSSFDGDQDGQRKSKFLKLMGAGTLSRGGLIVHTGCDVLDFCLTIRT